MSRLSLILTFFFFCSVCNSQTQQQIVKFLIESFPTPVELTFGRGFYDEKEKPSLYEDKTLSESLPNHIFYTFTLSSRGCYAFEKRTGIIIYEKNSNSFVVQPNMRYSSSGINRDFIKVMKLYQNKKMEKFESYRASIAKLLFSTLHDVYAIEKVVTLENYQIYGSNGNGNIKFEFEKNRITNIEYK